MNIDEVLEELDIDEEKVARMLVPIIAPLKDAGVLTESDGLMLLAADEETDLSVAWFREGRDGFVIRWGFMMVGSSDACIFCECRYDGIDDVSAAVRVKRVLGNDEWIIEFDEGIRFPELVHIAKRNGIESLLESAAIDERGVSRCIFDMAETGGLVAA